MDPNAVLAILRRAAAAIGRRNPEATPDEAIELADAAIALDDWITKGGFLPNDWQSAGEADR